MQKITSLYIHYPYCKHLCHYCDFYKHLYSSQANDEFESFLLKNLKVNRDFLASEGFELGDLETLYIGGGTPSLMGKSLISNVEKIKRYYDIEFSKNCEFTMEVDPGAYHSIETLKEIVNYGVNRVSIGIQSLDSVVHQYLDRSHGLDEVYKLIDLVSKLGMNFSVDFIIGVIGNETHKRNIEKELEEILSFSPNHISLYILSVNKSYKYFDLLPKEDEVAEEYQRVHDYLSSRDFNHYEVSNYALDGYESKHNWRYWEQKSYACLGPSATGLIVKEESGCRYRWKPSGDVDIERLSVEQLKLERLYTQARTRKGIEKKLVKTDISSLLEQGYLFENKDRYIVNPKYWNTLDSIVHRLL